ncbi:Sensor histidine kinase RcsC [Sinobacterium norvegicum]|uniref:histidine kinase n=1 Tax=Sinobacterium norvegicum TaxID=1641715 RepID=A0ABM9ACP7_9GAMM|nr:ATP-binding protein [Sinobacterium norvegicum]CAH0990956.1 Sensor histidine kinase RcsC [Sinobacterium norvegicum]
MSRNKLLESYDKSKNASKEKEIKTTYLVSILLMPAGYSMDYIIYPDYFWQLAIIRAVTIVILVIAYLIFCHRIKNKKNDHLSFFEFYCPTMVISSLAAMIYITNGVESPYYAAINLVIMGTNLLLPLTLTKAIINSASSIAIYLAAITLHNVGKDGFDLVTLYNNLYFLTLTSIIGCIACYATEKKRFFEFSLQYELNIKNKELARANQSKTEFFANISHELRTPLTLIISPLEDLERGDSLSRNERIELTSIIKKNSYRLLKLVNDLLTSIKIDAHQIGERQDIHILSLISETAETMRVIANKQKLSIRIAKMKDISNMFIDGNKDALDKIFINVINNAIKFTPPGGKITISFEYINGQLTTHISDTGIGINHNDLPHVFEPFRQGDSSATRNYQGTGLGLSLVKQLVEELDGSIYIDSIINQGTTVSITFPTKDCNDDVIDTSKPMQLSPLEKMHKKADFFMHLNIPVESHTLHHDESNLITPQQSGNTTHPSSILVVEDEPDLRGYLENILSPHYHVITASDGEQGLIQYQKHKPSLALVDLMLPKIDGIDLCRQIKSVDNHHCKIIMLTARTDEKSKIQALTNGADDFLNKPFSATELKTRLSNISDVQAFQKGLELSNNELKATISNLKATKGQLIQSEKLNSIGSLAAGLLHEVNNPLNYAFTAVQILQREPNIINDADSLEMVDDIHEGMERIKQIVSDLHNFAHPGSVDEHSDFLLYNTVDTAIRFTSADTKQISILITNNVDRNIEVKASNSHILQVFINLINNATAAMKNGKERNISINSKIVNGRVLISFKDSGCGIGKEKIDRIFEPFYTTRDVGKGIGMGLSICHTIIQSHHGSLTVNSEEGVFTEFQFDLTLASNTA